MTRTSKLAPRRCWCSIWAALLPKPKCNGSCTCSISIPILYPEVAPAHLKDLFVLCRVIKRGQLDDQGQDQLPLHQEAAELPPPLQSADCSNANASTSTSASTSGVLNPNPHILEDTIFDGNTTIPDDNTDYQKDDLGWMQEMYDPNFIPSSLLHPQFTVGTTPSAPKPAPAYYSLAQASEDETSFPLPEDIQNILGTDNHQNTQNLHFLEDQTTPTTSAFYCNVPGRSNEDDETGIVIRQRSATVTYDNPNDTDVSNINKYNLKSKLQMHLYKKDEETLQTANFAPKDALVGEFDNSASISGKDGNELKSTMPKRTELRRFGHGALLVGGIAMLVYLVSK